MDDFLLQVAEGGFAFTIEKTTDRAADALLDHVVRIDEGQPQPPGEVPPDGGFTRAWKADEVDAQLGSVQLLMLPKGLTCEAGGTCAFVMSEAAAPAKKLKNVLDSVPATMALAASSICSQLAYCCP